MNSFINRAFSQAQNFLPKKIMIMRGESITITANSTEYYKKGSLGGFEPEQTMAIAVKTADLPTDATDATGEKVTIDAEPWRIGKMQHGATLTNIDLISIHED